MFNSRLYCPCFCVVDGYLLDLSNMSASSPTALDRLTIIHRSSDYIPLPENRLELDYVRHDPLDSSDIINICIAIIGLIGNSLTLAVLLLK